jgi:replicative DNA helicase
LLSLILTSPKRSTLKTAWIDLDTLPRSLQESILAALLFDERQGAAISVQVTSSHFDESYRDVAEQALKYRALYNKPVGKTHIDDVFIEQLRAPKTGQHFRRLLSGLIDIADGINGAYLVTRTSEHIRRQELKAAILRAGERYKQGGEALVSDVEAILQAGLQSKANVLNPGLYFNNVDRVLQTLDRHGPDFPLAIKELDAAGVGLAAKELFLYIAPKGTGKTWFCVHVDKQAYMHNQKVLHLSLEVSEDIVAARCAQALFHGSWDDVYEFTEFEADERGRIVSWTAGKKKPALNFRSDKARDRLRSEMLAHGSRLGHILIKEFPENTLTVPQLTSFLDYLEQTEKFIPTVLIVDSPYLMKIDPRYYVQELGQHVAGLHGLAKQRNIALLCTHQSQRGGIKAAHVRSTHAAQSIAAVWTATNVVTYSQIEAEERRGFARLKVEHARNVRGGMEIVMAQAYSVGQFCTMSAYVSKGYWDRLGEDRPAEADETEGEEEDG